MVILLCAEGDCHCFRRSRLEFPIPEIQPTAKMMEDINQRRERKTSSECLAPILSDPVLFSACILVLLGQLVRFRWSVGLECSIRQKQRSINGIDYRRINARQVRHQSIVATPTKTPLLAQLMTRTGLEVLHYEAPTVTFEVTAPYPSYADASMVSVLREKSAGPYVVITHAMVTGCN